MLGEAFYWVFNMSVTAAIAGVFILAVRLVKKIPRRITVFLWLIPFLRMALPFGLNSPYSLMSLLSRITAKPIAAYPDSAPFSTMNFIAAADSYFPITYKEAILDKVFGAASAVWLVVFSAIFLTQTVVCFSTLREMRGAAHLRDNVWLSDRVMSPAVYGIVKPRIVLPPSFRDRDIELIILHETMHIRRADNLWRMLAFLIAAAHWFNPLCWVFLKLFLEDLELSCDERVLVKLGAARAGEYALALLESKQSAAFFASAFGGAKIRTRIENILSFKKMTWFSLSAFIALTAAVFVVLLTNAV